MKINILFTINAHVHPALQRRCLRGVFTDLKLLEKAKQTLIKNGVVTIDGCNEDEYFDIVSIEANKFKAKGGGY